MRRLLTVLGLGSALGLWSCRDGPTAPGTGDGRQVAIAPDELDGFLVALADVRTRILPALGSSTPTQALTRAVVELEGILPGATLPQLRQSLSSANAAVLVLRSDTTIQADLDVVLLTIEQIEASTHQSIERVPNTLSDRPVQRRRP